MLDSASILPEPRSHFRFQGEIFLIITTLLWGATFTITNQVTQIIPPMFYMGLRYCLGFLCFIPFLLKKFNFTKGMWRITVEASILLWISFALQTIDIQLTTAAKSAFITGLNVIMVPILLR